MKRILCVLAVAACSRLEVRASEVSIVCDLDATYQKEVAEELSVYLGQMYDDQFNLNASLPTSGKAIVLQSDDRSGEGYSIKTEVREDLTVTTIRGEGRRGLLYGTHALLENLGCGFYLSFETVPKKKENICLDGLDVANRPVIDERICLNWHNFLSGCSSWNLDDWQLYIDRSSKMGFNGLMTHLYANDPSFVFSHNGVTKEAGFLPNTVKGRQYGTQQVNDVRRLVGSEVFDGSVFGSEASKVPDELRVKSARDLLQKVHQYADSKMMNVWFGYDVDYELASPQEIIKTLPEHARILIRRQPNRYFGMPNKQFYLPIPDSPEGMAYYKSQVTQLFEQYPLIDNLVLWSRAKGSAFLTVTYSEFPDIWKKEFDAMALVNPALDRNKAEITGRFAVAKVYAAVRTCLNDIGKEDIRLWAGSWGSGWITDADQFYPQEVGFILLDYSVDFFKDKKKSLLLEHLSKNRKVLPVIWAHHDDGQYIGAPYVPYENLADKLVETGSSGVGIIHWTTRPLDIYFKNCAHQLWAMTQNATLQYTADNMAENMVSEENKNQFARYLMKWIQQGPRFGRETRSYFTDYSLSKSAIEGCQERLNMLNAMEDSGSVHLEYFRKLEEFMLVFHEAQCGYQDALKLCKKGDILEAQRLLSTCDLEEVIQKYVEAAKVNGITKGEQGVVVELNLSWIPQILSLKQTLGLEPTRINCGAINYPDLGVGLLFTNYLVDAEKNLWRILSIERATYFASTPASVRTGDIREDGFVIDKPLTLKVSPVLADFNIKELTNPNYFIAGQYEVTLLLDGEGVVEATLGSMQEGAATPVSVSGSLSGEKASQLKLVITLNSPGALQLKLSARDGKPIINGFILRKIGH